jgi:hypothetical protein
VYLVGLHIYHSSVYRQSYKARNKSVFKVPLFRYVFRLQYQNFPIIFGVLSVILIRQILQSPVTRVVTALNYVFIINYLTTESVFVPPTLLVH